MLPILSLVRFREGSWVTMHRLSTRIQARIERVETLDLDIEEARQKLHAPRTARGTSRCTALSGFTRPGTPPPGNAWRRAWTCSNVDESCTKTI